MSARARGTPLQLSFSSLFLYCIRGGGKIQDADGRKRAEILCSLNRLRNREKFFAAGPRDPPVGVAVSLRGPGGSAVCPGIAVGRRLCHQLAAGLCPFNDCPHWVREAALRGTGAFHSTLPALPLEKEIVFPGAGSGGVFGGGLQCSSAGRIRPRFLRTQLCCRH